MSFSVLVDSNHYFCEGIDGNHPPQPTAPHIQLNNYPGYYEPLHGNSPQENKPKEKAGKNTGQPPLPPEKLEINCETLKQYAQMAADVYFEISRSKNYNWKRVNENQR